MTAKKAHAYNVLWVVEWCSDQQKKWTPVGGDAYSRQSSARACWRRHTKHSISQRYRIVRYQARTPRT